MASHRDSRGYAGRDPSEDGEEEPRSGARAEAGATSKGLRPLAWITLLGVAWGQSSLLIGTLSSPAPATVGQAVAIEVSGLLTVVYVLSFRAWAPRLVGRARRNAVLLGVANAAIVQLIFVSCQAAVGAEGVAVHPNPFLALVVTMPWFAGVVWLFLRAHHRWRFSVPAVLLLGGLYQAGVDWLLAGVLLGGAPIGPAIVLLLAVYFWQFVVVYSSIVLPPALLVRAAPVREHAPGSRWADAVFPLGWLLPYAIYLVAVLSLLAGAGSG
jgi:hypothetical protein